MSETTMPAAFFGHGRPRITFEQNAVTDIWHDFSRSIPRPEAIVIVSAHWYIHATAVTAMERPRTVHDFFGQTPELFEFEYPCPGNPELARHMVDLVAPTWLGLDIDSWGLDHGAWALLSHLYPKADIPVVEMSVNATMPFDYHVALGAQLAPLRKEGVLVIGSGNIVHNGRPSTPEGRANGDYDKVVAFNAAVAEVMTEDPGSAAKLREHPGYKLAAPTDDHFVPLLYVAGLAAAAGEVTSTIIDGPALGSFGMSSYGLGLSD
jgi:4,5-DOPA dioxygenase extradiol